MSEEYYEKDGHLFQKEFLGDKDLGKFEENLWGGNHEVRDVWNNVVASKTPGSFFKESEVTIGEDQGVFEEPGLLDVSGRRQFVANLPPEEANTRRDSSSESISSSSDDYSTSRSDWGGYGGSSYSSSSSGTADYLEGWKGALAAVAVLLVAVLGLRAYGFEKAEKELRAFFSGSSGGNRVTKTRVIPPTAVAPRIRPAPSPSIVPPAKIENPLKNKELMAAIDRLLKPKRQAPTTRSNPPLPPRVSPPVFQFQPIRRLTVLPPRNYRIVPRTTAPRQRQRVSPRKRVAARQRPAIAPTHQKRRLQP